MSDATTVVTDTSSEQAAAAVDQTQAEVEGSMTEIEKMVRQAYLGRGNSQNGRPTPSTKNFSLDVFSTHVTVKQAGVEKNISLMDFKELLAASLMQEATEIPAFQLPQGCFYIGANEKLMQISCYYPEVKSKIRHSNSGSVKTYELMFPNIIVSQELTKIEKGMWQVTLTKYYCTPKKFSQLPLKFINHETSSDETYVLPFSNMYDNGTMCFGSNQMPMRHNSNLRGLGYFYDIISLATFNNDLPVRSISNIGGTSSWYEEWSKMSAFPYERLRHVR